MTKTDREHVFYTRWMARVLQRTTLARRDLNAIIRYPQYLYAASDIIFHAAKLGIIADGDVDWLLAVLPLKFPTHGFAHDQVRMLKALRDPGIGWPAKMKLMLELKAEWASQPIFNGIGADDVAETEAMITASSRPKRTKEMLRMRLKATK